MPTLVNYHIQQFADSYNTKKNQKQILPIKKKLFAPSSYSFNFKSDACKSIDGRKKN